MYQLINYITIVLQLYYNMEGVSKRQDKDVPSIGNNCQRGPTDMEDVSMASSTFGHASIAIMYRLQNIKRAWSVVGVIGQRTRKDRVTQPMDHGRLR